MPPPYTSREPSILQQPMSPPPRYTRYGLFQRYLVDRVELRSCKGDINLINQFHILARWALITLLKLIKHYTLTFLKSKTSTIRIVPKQTHIRQLTKKPSVLEMIKPMKIRNNFLTGNRRNYFITGIHVHRFLCVSFVAV